MDRRDFLGAGAGLALGGVLGLSPFDTRPGLDRVGLQLYTVREPLSRDFRGTLERVAAIGYREVEFAGYHGRSAEEAGRTARELGLDPVSAHVPLSAILDRPEALLDASEAAGHRHLVLAWVDEARRRTLDDWRRLAEALSGFGERCGARGFGFAYHNHAYEFEAVEGRVPYEVLVQESDPDLVGLQLDFYWLKAAGRDPLASIRRFGSRVASCHVKDMGERGRMVDVGAGVVDWTPILGEARGAGVEHFFVEHDRPEDPLASARAGYEHLQGLRVR